MKPYFKYMSIRLYTGFDSHIPLVFCIMHLISNYSLFLHSTQQVDSKGLHIEVKVKYLHNCSSVLELKGSINTAGLN